MSYYDKSKIGSKVHYTSPHGTKENGIVKSLNESKTAAFVVYNCAGDWDNYKNYTGHHTNINDLTFGWVDDKGDLMKEFCDHHYILDNIKWTPINRSTCQFCGDIID